MPKLPPPPPRLAQYRVGIRRAAGGADHPVGGDDPQRLQVVAAQPERAGQYPDAAAEGEAGDAHCGARPARHGQAPRGQPVVEVDQMDAGADGDRPGADVEVVDRGDVHDQAAVDRGPAAVAVPAGAGRHRQAEFPHEVHARAHVAGGRAVRDAGRPLGVEPRVEQFLGRRVHLAARPDQLVRGQRSPQRRPVGHARGGLWFRSSCITPADGRCHQARPQRPGQRDGARGQPGHSQEPAPVRRARPTRVLLAAPLAGFPAVPRLPCPVHRVCLRFSCPTWLLRRETPLAAAC